MPPNFQQSLPKIKIEISAMIARSFALPSQSTIPKQFLSRGGNATILPITTISVALPSPEKYCP
jgi:hypothetical protein